MLGFESSIVDVGETAIRVERGGAGPAVLLLHGFPETLAMWREIAPLLAERLSVVCADVRGYGASGCPPSAEDHAQPEPLPCARCASRAVLRRARADPLPNGNGLLGEGCLYQLVREHDAIRERTLEITFLEDGAEAYVFTFG